MKVLSFDGLNDIVPIISKFERFEKDRFQYPKSVLEMMKDWLQEGHVKVGMKMLSNSPVIGFAVIDQRENRILAIFADNLEGELEQQEINRIEIELLDWCFHELEIPPIRIEFPIVTLNMKESLMKRGYYEFERVGMVVRRDVFLVRERIKLPDEFVVEPYNPENRIHVADVIAKAHESHTDAMIYPEFYSSIDAGVEFLKKLEDGVFGKYNEGYSKVLITKGRIIGYCVITITGDIAVISAIGMLPEFQGRGLGKTLFVNSIIDILESECAVKGIGLAVTLSNPAKYLYEEQGFKICDEFSSIAYVGRR